jgi:hypothetical protein
MRGETPFSHAIDLYDKPRRVHTETVIYGAPRAHIRSYARADVAYLISQNMQRAGIKRAVGAVRSRQSIRRERTFHSPRSHVNFPGCARLHHPPPPPPPYRSPAAKSLQQSVAITGRNVLSAQ